MLSNLYNPLMQKKVFFVISLLLVVCGCSVHKAASNDGVAFNDIKNSKYKSALLARGMERIDTVENKNGTVTETYRAVARKSGVNYLRAAGHGAMDVMTLGLWEVVGTPVEGAISNNRPYIIAKATYADKTSEEIEQLDIYDHKGIKLNKKK